jgi:hypothetical protein
LFLAGIFFISENIHIIHTNTSDGAKPLFTQPNRVLRMLLGCFLFAPQGDGQ